MDQRTKWDIVIAFFLGGAVSSIAQDPSDYLFFKISSQTQGALTPDQQTFYWFWVPFLLYFAFALLAEALSRTGFVSPYFILYFYAFAVLVSAYLSSQLPQEQSTLYRDSVILGTAVSFAIIYGIWRRINR